MNLYNYKLGDCNHTMSVISNELTISGPDHKIQEFIECDLPVPAEEIEDLTFKEGLCYVDFSMVRSTPPTEWLNKVRDKYSSLKFLLAVELSKMMVKNQVS